MTKGPARAPSSVAVRLDARRGQTYFFFVVVFFVAVFLSLPAMPFS